MFSDPINIMVPWLYATMLYHIQLIRDTYIIFKEISGSQSGTETTDESATEAGNSKSKQTTALEPKQWSKRDFERRVRQVVRRYRKRSLL